MGERADGACSDRQYTCFEWRIDLYDDVAAESVGCMAKLLWDNPITNRNPFYCQSNDRESNLWNQVHQYVAP